MVIATPRANTDVFTLNTGAIIPAVGFGTWQSEDNQAYEAVKVALANGYKHIDTAAIYKNEEQVGKAIKDSKISREELFITTKLWNTDHKRVAEALDESLKKLGLDYVDLYLIHWPLSTDPATGEPYSDVDYLDAYKELQKLQKSGKTRAIGVSNFTQKQVQRVLDDKDVTIVPAVNQIEAHPLLTQPELTEYLQKHNIVVEAYSPLGSTNSPLFKNPTVVELAEKYEVEPAQVLISWALQRKTVVLPKSVTEKRIISNFKTFELVPQDFKKLSNLSEQYGVQRLNTLKGVDFSD
ncbi:Piso0_001988 [Millerozyma farinosa CBS 7064]|uniref:2-dehydropantolactone reductase n=1 Tax=Pichia sorbitophila (strain ATCC MYA-4447 / BCRC 22081 / CBS 7064 / NBRC 10061 / NRRL Y-12695) TaxID=559304 RepID=G8YBE0_PICSO|nr:Piso0_001988 [Millerozyma farinosa CBS 7064]